MIKLFIQPSYAHLVLLVFRKYGNVDYSRVAELVAKNKSFGLIIDNNNNITNDNNSNNNDTNIGNETTEKYTPKSSIEKQCTFQWSRVFLSSQSNVLYHNTFQCARFLFGFF